MAVNKVVYGDDTLIDLTADTVTSETLLAGTTAHDASGTAITGTFEMPIATTGTAGIVKIGSGLEVTDDGTVSTSGKTNLGLEETGKLHTIAGAMGGGEYASIEYHRGDGTSGFMLKTSDGLDSANSKVLVFFVNSLGEPVLGVADSTGGDIKHVAMLSDLSSYLPLSGGTMTGAIKGLGGSSNGAHLYAGDNNFDGATLQLFAPSHDTYPGHFYLRASSRVDGDSSKGVSVDLRGKPDGSLTWNGKEVLREDSINKAGTGFVKLSNGIIYQWGSVSTSASKDTTITFPNAFSSTNIGIGIVRTSGATTTSNVNCWCRSVTTTQMKIYCSAATGIRWVAIGY